MTPLQIKTLQAVADGKVFVRNHGYGAWRINGANPSVVGRLASLKLVSYDPFKEADAVLTEAGRDALAKTTGESAS